MQNRENYSELPEFSLILVLSIFKKSVATIVHTHTYIFVCVSKTYLLKRKY